MQRACFMAGESAERTWRHVIPNLQDDTDVVIHELLGREGGGPDYTWQAEVDALRAELVTGGPAHLVGFSAGATLALALVAAEPQLALSLVAVEPAWSFLAPTSLEVAYWQAFARLLELPASSARDAFRRLIVAEDTPVPPIRPDLAERERERGANGAPSPLRTLTLAMQAHRIDPTSFGRFRGVAVFVVGGRSHPMWIDQAGSLAAAFPRGRIVVFPERHHLDPPQRTEVDAVTELLRSTWASSPAA
jgi:pimeloyl-ACP methyl ester carboxylesterase